MPRALLRAQRAGEVVIGESKAGAVLRVQRHLKDVRQGAAVPVAAPGAIG
jgi:hypothetical protein